MTSELQFLRELEMDVHEIRQYAGSPSLSGAIPQSLLTALKVKLNTRIIELLERETRRATLDELTAQAQELNMGYEDK